MEQGEVFKEFNKTIAKVLDVADLSNISPKFKDYMKTEVWDLFNRLYPKSSERGKELNGNSKIKSN